MDKITALKEIKNLIDTIVQLGELNSKINRETGSQLKLTDSEMVKQAFLKIDEIRKEAKITKKFNIKKGQDHINLIEGFYDYIEGKMIENMEKGNEEEVQTYRSVF